MRKYILVSLLFFSITTHSQHNTMGNYEYDKEILNASGQRHGTLVYASILYGVLDYSHIYNNGALLQTTDFRFEIEGKKELVGKYKDDLPYDGYFVNENKYEIAEIDYYEKGIFQFKYTTTILAMMEPEMTGMKPKMIKNSYKNGKLTQGLNHKGYQMDGSNLLVTEYYENGAITHADLWLLAIHYAELIKIKFSPNGYEIYSESKSDTEGDPEMDTRSASIIVQFTDADNGNVSFSIENELIGKYQFCKKYLSSKIDLMQKIIIYSLTDDDTIVVTNKFNFEDGDNRQEQYSYSNRNILTGFYMNSIYKPIPMFHSKKDNNYLQILEFSDSVMENTILILNEERKPFIGSYIEKEGKYYKYSKYEDSKVVASKNKLTIDDIKGLLFSE